MVATEELLITQIPESFFEAVARDLAECSVGFLRIEDTPRGQDAILLGSGTLVTVGKTHAVLTAHHVVKVLPKAGRVGLILSSELQQHTVNTQALAYVEIARGTVDSDGPDLGAVILAPSIAAAIAAKKTFYNLELRRERMLQTPPDRQDGVWFVHGFVGERTVEEPSSDGFSLVKSFYSLSGAGGPDEPPVSVGDHDYLSFPVSYGCRSVAPTSFGGMSGGGLWQVPLMRDAQGNPRPKTFLLSGVVFYQEPTTENRCGVKCHGRSSIYKVAYEAIGNAEP
jgi:hypothetical protein